MPRFTMKFISICSGIDAASVAFNPLGWKAVAFSEIEPFPCAVLAHHYPDVPNLGDMTRYAEWPDEIFLEADAIVGGPPCQAFSVAGMRNGLNDERGNLTLIYFQLINHADSIRKNHGRPPVIALYENVFGLLSDKTGAFGCLLAGLAGEDEALDVKKWPRAGVVDGGRRRVAWVTLDAQYFGVAQRRRRVFVLAVPGELVERLGDRAHPAEILSVGNCLRRDTPPRREAGQVAPTVPARSTAGGGLGTDFDCDGGLIQAFGGNNQAGPIDVATARNACASASGRMDFESETFLVQPCFAIKAGALRTNPASGPDGVGVQADHAYTLEARAEVRAVVAFHPTQDPISSTDGSTHAMGCGSSGGQASIAVAFSCKDFGGDAGAISPTLRAMGGAQPNGGGQVAVAYALQDVRDVQKAQNGRGWNDEGVSYTVDTAATQGVAYSTKLHNTASNQAGKFYEEYTTAPDRSSPPPAVIAPVAIGAFKGGQGSAAGGIGWDAHVSPTLSSADSGSNRAPVVLTGESEVVGALACNTGPNGHDAGNFACNQAVDAGHVLPMVFQGRGRAEGRTLEVGGDVAYALTAPNGGGRAQERNVLTPAMQVRRLTPVECEKLQGFPPGYTNIPWGKEQSGPVADGVAVQDDDGKWHFFKPTPDGPRYKALGNSWATPVVSWIGRRIAEVL